MTITTTPDLELLDEVFDHIDTHPEEHDQVHWICGTTACIGGRTCLLRGWSPLRPNVPRVTCVTKNGEMRHIGELSRELLRLDRTTANRLFCAANTVDDLHLIQKEIHGGPRELLSWERAAELDRDPTDPVWADWDHVMGGTR
jgi:hypothetical protein